MSRVDLQKTKSLLCIWAAGQTFGNMTLCWHHKCQNRIYRFVFSPKEVTSVVAFFCQRQAQCPGWTFKTYTDHSDGGRVHDFRQRPFWAKSESGSSFFRNDHLKMNPDARIYPMSILPTPHVPTTLFGGLGFSALFRVLPRAWAHRHEDMFGWGVFLFGTRKIDIGAGGHCCTSTFLDSNNVCFYKHPTLVR